MFYLLQIEDEGNHGNDDTRLFILSTLAGQHKPRVSCALCKETLHVFDRYPLVDGTFFLSPRQHTSSAVEVRMIKCKPKSSTFGNDSLNRKNFDLLT